jgi:DNA-binding transcriptional regulator YiaG
MGEFLMVERKTFAVTVHNSTTEPYHYKACGLDDVYLENGFTFEPIDGELAISIQNIDGLHQAIAMHIALLDRAIKPREFRFLRKAMDFSQEHLAQQLAVDVQTVARYEKDQTAIPAPTDLMLRMIYVLSVMPEAQQAKALRDALDAVRHGGADQHGKVIFSRHNDLWDGAVTA